MSNRTDRLLEAVPSKATLQGAVIGYLIVLLLVLLGVLSVAALFGPIIYFWGYILWRYLFRTTKPSPKVEQHSSEWYEAMAELDAFDDEMAALYENPPLPKTTVTPSGLYVGALQWSQRKHQFETVDVREHEVEIKDQLAKAHKAVEERKAEAEAIERDLERARAYMTADDLRTMPIEDYQKLLEARSTLRNRNRWP